MYGWRLERFGGYFIEARNCCLDAERDRFHSAVPGGEKLDLAAKSLPTFYFFLLL